MADMLRVSFECDIGAGALWDIAAERAAADFAMSPDDVLDMIGPREDPEVEACVLMLLDPIARRTDLSRAISIRAVPPADSPIPAPLARAPTRTAPPDARRFSAAGAVDPFRSNMPAQPRSC